MRRRKKKKKTFFWMSIDEVKERRKVRLCSFSLSCLSLSHSFDGPLWSMPSSLASFDRSTVSSSERVSLSLSLLRKELLSKTVWWPTTFLGPLRVHRHSHRRPPSYRRCRRRRLRHHHLCIRRSFTLTRSPGYPRLDLCISS